MVSEVGERLSFWELSQAPCRWRGAYSLRDGHFIGRYEALRKMGVLFFVNKMPKESTIKTY